jgi:hypothetical protein
MRSIEVPPGTVFGRLTVIGEAPRVGARSLRAMLCRCECGTVRTADLNELRRGSVTSCGCARRKVNVPPGTVFGRLTVIKETRANGKRAMLCQCDCGQQKTVTLSALRSGRTRTCGTLHGVAADAARLKPGEVPLYGKKVQGRVALVDPGDWDLVMRYRWFVQEPGRP